MNYPRVLAKRKAGLEFLYFGVAILGVVFAIAISTQDVEPGYYGVTAVFILAGFVMGILIVSAPKTPVVLISENEIALPDGKRIPLSQISFVRYKRAYARGITYRWGTLTIISMQGEFTFRYVADCEAVAQEIMELKERSFKTEV